MGLFLRRLDVSGSQEALIVCPMFTPVKGRVILILVSGGGPVVVLTRGK